MISGWLKAKNKPYGLDYWHQVNWPPIKLELHRRSFLGFTFYRKTPLALGDYEAMVRHRIRRRGYDYRTGLISNLAADMREASR
mgnify:CR=1 FL=1